MSSLSKRKHVASCWLETSYINEVVKTSKSPKLRLKEKM